MKGVITIITDETKRNYVGASFDDFAPGGFTVKSIQEKDSYRKAVLDYIKENTSISLFQNMMLWDSSLSDMSEIIRFLKNNNILNVTVKYIGYNDETE